MNDKTHIEALPADLGSRVQQYLDGEISSDDFVELAALMERSRPARAFYRSYANMDANLREISEGEGTEVVVPMLPARRRFAGAMLQAVATFVLGAVFVYAILGQRDERGTAGGGVGTANLAAFPAAVMVEDGLAILTQTVGVTWASGRPAISAGSTLPAGNLELEKGLLQVEFSSGTIVVIEGPADFELVDPMRAICHGGKFRAIVPEAARGFTVASELMDVVALGAEFASDVDADGLGEVHVFDGGVELHEKPGDKLHTLMAGNGVRLGGGEPVFLPLNEMGFVDAQRVSFLANAEADEHLARWLIYSEELKAHPDVLLYYSFDEKTTWSRELRNVRKMTATPLHGAIVGCSWSDGRWDGKASLEFKRSGDRVRIQIPGKHDEFSLMAWVRIDGFDRELNSLMLSDNWVSGGVHWQFTREGELILGTKDERSSGHYRSLPVLNQSHLGRWIQLAVSYDTKAGRVAHYLNGEVVWEGEMSASIPISVPMGELGNWRTDYEQNGSNLRNLNGRMDEFVVFSRGLSDEEMRKLYDSGKPHS